MGQHASNQYRLSQAAKNGDAATVAQLLNNGANVNEVDMQPHGTSELTFGILILFFAGMVLVKNVLLVLITCIILLALVQVFMAQYFGKTGNTPLHWAVQNKHHEVVHLLMQEKQVNIKCCNAVGKTALDLARQQKHNHVMLTLLTTGMQQNSTAVEGKQKVSLQEMNKKQFTEQFKKQSDKYQRYVAASIQWLSRESK